MKAQHTIQVFNRRINELQNRRRYYWSDTRKKQPYKTYTVKGAERKRNENKRIIRAINKELTEIRYWMKYIIRKTQTT
jgi:hypothetical protein